MRSLTILGATGSIGSSALDIVRSCRDSYELVALTGGSDLAGLLRLGREFSPRFLALWDSGCSGSVEAMDYGGDIGFGESAIADAAAMESDIVLVAIPGLAALRPTVAALVRGCRVALANKECLVSAGSLVMSLSRRYGSEILPVDSEHNALFQLLVSGGLGDDMASDNLRRVILTASGGPFRDLAMSDFGDITVEMALAHPNWRMGRKNSIDSATMMNKGLEVIEAHYLFGLGAEKIDILVHPQSLVHALVEYEDGSIFAHLSPTDMRFPVKYALDYPRRLSLPSGCSFLDLAEVGRLDFSLPDEARFPCLSLARDALLSGGFYPVVLNGANEVAVEEFLAGRLSFGGISDSVSHSLDKLSGMVDFDGLDENSILSVDSEARRVVGEFIAGRSL